MFKLFAIEWMKIKSYRAFWVLFGSFVVLFPVTFFLIAHFYMRSSESQQEEVIKSMLGSPFIFPNVWQASGFFGGLFFIMVGMLFIMLITNEVSYKTHRQNIIDGWSRMDFLKAKLSVMIFFVLVSTILVIICGLFAGMMYTKGSYSLTERTQHIGYFVLMALMYLIVAFLIAILVKRTGLCIIIYFGFVCIVDNILWGLLTMKGAQFGYFLPLETTDSLITNPWKPYAFERRTVSDSTLVIAASVYIIGFCYFISSYFKRIDLKT